MALYLGYLKLKVQTADEGLVLIYACAHITAPLIEPLAVPIGFNKYADAMASVCVDANMHSTRPTVLLHLGS